jgi:uncharacterized protein YbjT (DUF2867 family)
LAGEEGYKIIIMKIVVIGGTGLIGSRLVNKLNQLKYDHEIVSASLSSGVNTITGQGLEAALAGAQIVVDVSNSPSFDAQVALNFFETSSRNLLKAEKAIGVKHHIILSVVGTERLQQSGYFQAKQIQENLVKESGLPYSILHSTQFFELAGAIARSSMIGDEVHIAPVAFQPISSDEVADTLVDIVLGAPLNGTVEVGGPVQMPMDEFIRYYLNTTEDFRQLVTDKQAHYFGAPLTDETLVPADHARLGKIKYEDWCRMQYSRVKA